MIGLVMDLADLHRQDKMNDLQLAIVLVGVGIGVQMVSMSGKIVKAAEQSAWLSLLLGAVIYGSAACGMVRLGQAFPKDTFVEYMPKLLGKRAGMLVAGYVLLMLSLIYCVILRSFTNIIATSLFDRTPLEVIAMVMLALSAYGAVQRWGTILRIMQVFFFISLPVIIVIWSTTILNFNIENLMPFWPERASSLLVGALQSWDYYSGYEIILIVLPLVRPSSLGVFRAVSGAFGVMGVIYALGMLIVIGTLSIGTINQATYPMIAAVRGVEIPGTFVERLENYLLLAWIPVVFDTLMLLLYGVAQIAMRLAGLKDHRPHVIGLAPFLFIAATLLDRKQELDVVSNLLSWLGLGFSLGLVPLCLLVVWIRRKNA